MEIKDLRVSIEGKQILKGVNLKVTQGEIHAIMGPNGSGKSTLANTLMGHPKYKVDGGEILVNGENIVGLAPDVRAKKGLFLAFQYPLEISGVPLAQFLRSAYRAVRGETQKKPDGKSDPRGVGGEMISALAFKKKLEEKLKEVDMDPAFAKRYLNEGFSGGEKKRAEILQMAILQPAIAIMDETDSGLDIDAVRKVAEVISHMAGPEMGVRTRWTGRRPKGRGVAMNPIDHPHGGGEGRTSGGRHPVTPWGVSTKGHKTRSKKKRSNIFIIRRRK